MFLVRNPRAELLPLLPRSGTVAEIGVAVGDFSAEILARNTPKELHLIDPWRHQDDADYQADVNNVPDQEADARHLHVRNRFATQIDQGSVILHREMSYQAASRFAPGTFDWIYIDAMHTRDAVRRDLEDYAPLLKPDGLIAGHDYTNHALAAAQSFGVVEAVNGFVRDHGWTFCLLTHESWPTYVIAPPSAGNRARALLDHAAASMPVVLELESLERLDFRQVINYRDGKATHFHYRIGPPQGDAY